MATTNLLSLPLENRTQIYEYLLLVDELSVLLRPEKLGLQLDILRVNKQIHVEASRVLLESNGWFMISGCDKTMERVLTDRYPFHVEKVHIRFLTQAMCNDHAWKMTKPTDVTVDLDSNLAIPLVRRTGIASIFAAPNLLSYLYYYAFGDMKVRQGPYSVDEHVMSRQDPGSSVGALRYGSLNLMLKETDEVALFGISSENPGVELSNSRLAWDHFLDHSQAISRDNEDVLSQSSFLQGLAADLERKGRWFPYSSNFNPPNH